MVSHHQPILQTEKYVGEKAKYARERDDVTPRNGSELVVGVVARISGCRKQKEVSLEDQVDHAKEKISEFYAGPVELRIVATKGKGEDLERPELKVVELRWTPLVGRGIRWNKVWGWRPAGPLNRACAAAAAV